MWTSIFRYNLTVWVYTHIYILYAIEEEKNTISLKTWTDFQVEYNILSFFDKVFIYNTNIYIFISQYQTKLLKQKSIKDNHYVNTCILIKLSINKSLRHGFKRWIVHLKQLRLGSNKFVTNSKKEGFWTSLIWNQRHKNNCNDFKILNR